MDRRKFLGLIGGAAALGVAGKASYELIAAGEIDMHLQGAEGKRWAMVIDTGKFDADAHKKCIHACNEVHNVPDIENPNHEIKWIWTENYHHAFIEQENPNLPDVVKEMPVLLLCNHCDKPPCTNVCPTKATWRREDGIVMMDWHRCIGCRYCIAACPYGSRSFNFIEPRQHVENITEHFPARTRGVVEKCTFCAELIVDGEYTRPPACVEAAPKNAIFFGDLHDKNSDVYKILKKRFSIRRKPELGTHPEVYYLVDEEV